MGGEMMVEITRRRYGCPDDCGLGCVIEVAGTRVIDDWDCPGGRGHMYGWVEIEQQPDCFGTEDESPKCRRCKYYAACAWTYLHKEALEVRTKVDRFRGDPID